MFAAYPSPRRKRRVLPHKGGAGSLLRALRPDMRSPCRDAERVRSLSNSPLNEGMARRKAQTYSSAILADHGGRLPARQSQRLFGTGPRFPVRASRSSRPEAGSATPKSSASSWQGLVMDPGEARRRPERFVANEARRGTAPRPASRRLMRTPLQKDEVGQA